MDKGRKLEESLKAWRGYMMREREERRKREKEERRESFSLGEKNENVKWSVLTNEARAFLNRQKKESWTVTMNSRPVLE